MQVATINTLSNKCSSPIKENNTTHKIAVQGENGMSTKEQIAQSFGQTLQVQTASVFLIRIKVQKLVNNM